MKNETSDTLRLRAINGPLGWAGLCFCFGLTGLFWSYIRYEHQTSSHLSQDQVIVQLATIDQFNSLLQQMGSENVAGVKDRLIQGFTDRISVLSEQLEAVDNDTRGVALLAMDRLERFYKAHPEYYTDSQWFTNRQDLRVAEAIQRASTGTR